MAIILRKFNYEYINNSSLIFIIGLKEFAKNIITKDLLYNNSEIESGLVISPSIGNYDYIPSIFIYDKYDRKIIKKYIKKQFELNREYPKDIYNTRSFIILEDIMYLHHWKKDKYLDTLFKSLSAINSLCIIQHEYMIDINDNLHKNIDYIFILKENLDKNRRKIYDTFNKELIIPYSLFCKLLDDYTQKYNFLILDIKSKSINIQDKLFWYNADNHNDFKIFSIEAWNFSNENLIEEKNNNKEDYIQKLFNRELLF